ncbi:OB-fold domain-containing protein [Rhodococcus sp. IEGM 1366]|uniref:Zn-ribbon domain-containing OB-fold protein n=1 Tax=Rhodococcus sp. IEGM 1366 TaxID=3082223 RepID=UPI0029554BCD|nr:OB-fold domain-containing protein [Rhodococcus sp. IEGM 1366]MDV8071368.1 OB-fold domain-containing protein [Rhodococcus sp. IEGM 1366]
MNIELPPQTGQLPHADPNPVTAPFWEGCARGELLFQRCGQCGSATFPPIEHCRECLAFDQRWESSRGLGRLYSWTVVSRPVTPAFTAPYAAAIVTLDEGYTMVTNVIGTSSDQLRVDLPVQVAYHKVGADLVLPYFEPARPAFLPYRSDPLVGG